MQEHLTELKAEEREVAAQLTWKVLEEEPVLVNGTVPSAEQPKQMQWLEPTEQSPSKPKEEEEEDEEEKSPTDEPQELRVMEEQPDEESGEVPSSPEEPEPKNDPLGDLYTSMLSKAGSTAWPQNHMVRCYSIL